MRTHFMAAIALATTLMMQPAVAQTTTGVSATEIKLGQTIPLSGPVSAYATFSRASLAYFAMVNERGGINGRKINLISVDDAFSPPKTVEQTRKLVESDEVFAIYASMGSLTATAVQKYLNGRGIPQFLIQSGLSRWNNPKEFPWSISGLPNIEVEVAIYARYILANMPTTQIGVIYQNDDFGRAYVSALKASLGDRSDMIVAAESFALGDPTVDSQVVKLASMKPGALLIAATARQAVQTIKKMAELNWRPQVFLAYPSASVERTYQPAGLENAKGIISSSVFKDPADPETAGDPDVAAYLTFMEKFYPGGDKYDTLNVAAFVEGEIMSRLLQMCGADVTRENLLAQAQKFREDALPMIRKGIDLRLDGENYNLFRTLQLLRFDGVRNRNIDVTTGN